MKNVNFLNLNKLLKFKQNDARIGGSNMAMTHKKQILKGIDAYGHTFNAYTPKYAKEKSGGEYAGQISSKVSPPNLTLTGQMLKSFKFIKSNVMGEIKIEYGISDSDQATKMIANNLGRFGKRRMADAKGRKRKKVVKRDASKRVVAANQNVGPNVESEIVNMFAEVIGRNIRKLDKHQVVVVHRI